MHLFLYWNACFFPRAGSSRQNGNTSEAVFVQFERRTGALALAWSSAVENKLLIAREFIQA
jgi:hypothetical protein